MNTWNGSGFLTKDPDIKEIQTKSGENMKMARFTIACQRKGKTSGADFISCVAYGKTAEVLEKYFSKGRGIEVRCHIQTGSYEKNGSKVYTTDLVVDELEFPKVRKGDEEIEPNDTHTEESTTQEQPKSTPEGFMSIPSDDSMTDLPFR